MATPDKGVSVKPRQRVYSTELQMYPEDEPPPSLPLMVRDNGPPTGWVYPPEMQTSAGDTINTLMYSFQN